MDGVLYRGEEALPGARELIAFLRERGIGIRFVTNNSTLHRRDYVRKLAGMGIKAALEEIVTSGSAAADYLARHYLPRGKGRVLVVGEGGLRTELRERGLTLVSSAPAPRRFGSAQRGEPAEPQARDGEHRRTTDVVVVGMDTHITYAKLAAASTAILQGAKFIATNPDVRFPTEQGLQPGAGSIVAAVAAAAGAQPKMIGKPETTMFAQAVRSARVPPSKAVVVGDGLETDVPAARKLGAKCVLVLTGVTTRRQLRRARLAPDLVCEDLRELLRMLRRGGR
jgi:4-nitrophenyl phosphatase